MWIAWELALVESLFCLFVWYGICDERSRSVAIAKDYRGYFDKRARERTRQCRSLRCWSWTLNGQHLPSHSFWNYITTIHIVSLTSASESWQTCYDARHWSGHSWKKLCLTRSSSIRQLPESIHPERQFDETCMKEWVSQSLSKRCTVT